MKSLGWALIQYNWYPYKKRKFGHEYTQKKDDVKRYKEKIAIYKSKREAWNTSLPHSP